MSDCEIGYARGGTYESERSRRRYFSSELEGARDSIPRAMSSDEAEEREADDALAVNSDIRDVSCC